MSIVLRISLPWLTTVVTCSFFLTRERPDLNRTPEAVCDPLSAMNDMPDETDFTCFNETLLSGVNEHIKKTLSLALHTYSTSHVNHISRVLLSQCYMNEHKYRRRYLLGVPNRFNHSACYNFMMYPEHYRHYTGDILASLDFSSHLAFFSQEHSSRRFHHASLPVQVSPPFSQFSFID